MSREDPWNPGLYERFKTERAQPLFDLAALVEPRPAMRVVDLGCGTGEHTAWLHARLGAAETLGVDLSPAMLERAQSHGVAGVRFAPGDLALFPGAFGGGWDLIFSNAALHWVGNHRAVLERLFAALSPGGQLAVQVPSLFSHPSHTVAFELASEPAFRDAFSSPPTRFEVATVAQYSRWLFELGFARQSVRLQAYPHVLAGPDQVVDWFRGTLLTDFERRLSAELFEVFVAQYRERLLPRLGGAPGQPYFFPFERILIWAGR